MRADFNTRLERLEAKQYDTKPIWQQALAEIMQANKRLEDFDVRFDRMESDVAKTRSEMLSLRADFKEFRAHFKEPA
jgi:predicted  nucleic acid-binding Zn-ribbon protein